MDTSSRTRQISVIIERYEQRSPRGAYLLVIIVVVVVRKYFFEIRYPPSPFVDPHGSSDEEVPANQMPANKRRLIYVSGDTDRDAAA